jgi:hypothetical protein
MYFQHICLVEDTDDCHLTETDLSVTNGAPASPQQEEGKVGGPKPGERKPGEPMAEERKPGEPMAEERTPGEPKVEERKAGEPKAKEPDTNEAQRVVLEPSTPQPEAPQQDEPTPGTSSDNSNPRISSRLVAKISLINKTIYTCSNV